MSPTASSAEIRRWISSHLDPLDAPNAEAETHSDYDLGLPPGPPPDAPTLTPAAVLVGLVERPSGFSVLLTRRSDNLRSHTGQIALPGGRCEADETPWGAALRESHEEIGLDPACVELAGLSTPYRTGSGFHITPVVGFVTAPLSLTPNPGEVAEIFETPFGFLMDPANYQEHEMDMPEGLRRRFYATTWENRFIWGATAGMLRALYSRLYGAALA
jgi:8-oxo-dGTP pyrophosphatase MutT (NUDIX family)